MSNVVCGLKYKAVGDGAYRCRSARKGPRGGKIFSLFRHHVAQQIADLLFGEGIQ